MVHLALTLISSYSHLLAQAIVNYQSHTLSTLVELLGMIYRPYRYDFMNLKYFYRDFPPEVVARVEQLYCVTDLADLAKKQQLAEEMFAEILPGVETALQLFKLPKDS
ncbi:hypothetical protein NIES4073_10120 [Kalymmatonema gypsitolerans NIES-4073]|nr:hypothetical protein NIES4073_10120 [Scytonema sp. NIES-4073]